jgi:hypothetical protein
MRRYLVIAGLGVTLTSCATWSDDLGVCFQSQQLISPAGAGELKAVEFVRRKEAGSCRPVNVECNLRLNRGNDGQIEVVASRAFVEGEPPACTHLEGGFKTYVFSAEGKYIRVELGL